jgi:hypothetical protein
VENRSGSQAVLLLLASTGLQLLPADVKVKKGEGVGYTRKRLVTSHFTEFTTEATDSDNDAR